LQDILKRALAWSPTNDLAQAFDCSNALAALSNGWDFKQLERNLLAFGHNVALACRKNPSG
jgi:hypothetical protein